MRPHGTPLDPIGPQRFLFVVVGEIKAGKSSLVNALLGESVCPVDPAPCTDTIQLIVHGETPAETEIAPHVRRI